jgi:hypothetical protein
LSHNQVAPIQEITQDMSVAYILVLSLKCATLVRLEAEGIVLLDTIGQFNGNQTHAHTHTHTHTVMIPCLFITELKVY